MTSVLLGYILFSLFLRLCIMTEGHVKYPCLQDDTTFTASLRLHMYKHSPSDVAVHDVTQTCSYTRWAPKEILCDRNYMEVGCFTFMFAQEWLRNLRIFAFVPRCLLTWPRIPNRLRLKDRTKMTPKSTQFLV